MKYIALLLVFATIATPVFSETKEAAPLETTTLEVSSVVTPEVTATKHNYLQELDITFWQTLPFAAFWGHFIDKQLSHYLSVSGAPHWGVILSFATIVSMGNASIHSRRVIENERTGDRN